jgi:hypothetical protein
MCPVRFAQSAVLISLYGIYCLVSVLEAYLVSCEVGTEYMFIYIYILLIYTIYIYIYSVNELLSMKGFVSSPVTYVSLYPCYLYYYFLLISGAAAECPKFS